MTSTAHPPPSCPTRALPFAAPHYVDRVLDAAGDRPSVVCGWSMGGLVALMAAQRAGKLKEHALKYALGL